MGFDEALARAAIRDVADYPKKGIVFKDITPLLKDPIVLDSCLNEMALRLSGKKIDYVVGVEARGFIFGTALALKLDKGFVPIRKKGKLPYRTIETSYDLEYGSATIEAHIDAIEKGKNVVIVDDLLATGGTVGAAARLVKELGGTVVAFVFLVELGFLKGRDKLDGEIISLITY